MDLRERPCHQCSEGMQKASRPRASLWKNIFCIALARWLFLLRLITANIRKAKVIPKEARGVPDQHSPAFGRLKRKVDVTRGFPHKKFPDFM